MGPKQKFHCVVTTCLYSSDTKEGLCKFPDNQDRCDAWAKALGLADYKRNSFVCPAHFLPDDFNYFTSGKKRLKPTAVPKVSHVSYLNFSKIQFLRLKINVIFWRIIQKSV